MAQLQNASLMGPSLGEHKRNSYVALAPDDYTMYGRELDVCLRDDPDGDTATGWAEVRGKRHLVQITATTDRRATFTVLPVR